MYTRKTSHSQSINKTLSKINFVVLVALTVGERVDLGGLAGVAVDSAKACQGVGTFNVHGARTANTFTARPTEGQGRIHLVFDLDESVQHHWATGIQVNLVFLERWLFCRLIWVLSASVSRQCATGGQCR
jgi:hypothetical protein